MEVALKESPMLHKKLEEEEVLMDVGSFFMETKAILIREIIVSMSKDTHLVVKI